jgi:hypothetical protein
MVRFVVTHFQHVAEVYGRIIISEQFVPLEEKTIRLQTHIGTWSNR